MFLPEEVIQIITEIHSSVFVTSFQLFVALPTLKFQEVTWLGIISFISPSSILPILRGLEIYKLWHSSGVGSMG